MSDTFDMESRKAWNRDGKPSVEDLNLGCLQRIATATETMAKHHDDLVRERDYFRSDRDFWRREAERLGRRVTALRGVVTRIKRKQFND